MTESRPGEDVAQKLEHDADELEHRLETLDDHITEASKAADARREEAMPIENVAGDWEETRGSPGQGEDPEGAIGEHGTREGATQADATEDDAGAAQPRRDDEVGSRIPGHASGGDD